MRRTSNVVVVAAPPAQRRQQGGSCALTTRRGQRGFPRVTGQKRGCQENGPIREEEEGRQSAADTGTKKDVGLIYV